MKSTMERLLLAHLHEIYHSCAHGVSVERAVTSLAYELLQGKGSKTQYFRRPQGLDSEGVRCGSPNSHLLKTAAMDSSLKMPQQY